MVYKATELDWVQEKAARQVLNALNPFSIGRAISALRRLAMTRTEGRFYVEGDRVFILKRWYYTDRPEDFEWHLYPVDVYLADGFDPNDEDTFIPLEIGDALLCQVPECEE